MPPVQKRPVVGKNMVLVLDMSEPLDWEAPQYEELKKAQNVSITQTKNMTSAASRIKGVDFQEGANKVYEISGEYLHVMGGDDDYFALLNDSFQNDTLIHVAALDSSIANEGAYGIRMVGQVSQLSWQQDLESASVFSFAIVPSYYQYSPGTGPDEVVEPEWMVVGGVGPLAVQSAESPQCIPPSELDPSYLEKSDVVSKPSKKTSGSSDAGDSST